MRTRLQTKTTRRRKRRRKKSWNIGRGGKTMKILFLFCFLRLRNCLLSRDYYEVPDITRCTFEWFKRWKNFSISQKDLACCATQVKSDLWNVFERKEIKNFHLIFSFCREDDDDEKKSSWLAYNERKIFSHQTLSLSFINSQTFLNQIIVENLFVSTNFENWLTLLVLIYTPEGDF